MGLDFWIWNAAVTSCWISHLILAQLVLLWCDWKLYSRYTIFNR
jgi:hypothetical protein